MPGCRTSRGASPAKPAAPRARMSGRISIGKKSSGRRFRCRPNSGAHPARRDLYTPGPLVRCGFICGVYLSDALIRSWSLPMSLTKLAVAEAKINRRSEAARKGGDLAGMQRRWPNSPHSTGPTTGHRRGTEGLVRGGQRGADIRRPIFHWEGARRLPPTMLFRAHEIR
jgi:hypothetical protein